MGLDPEMLRSDIERHAGTLREHISSAQEILDRLLGSISRVDFHQLAGKEETARIPKNCYVVLIIDHILDECKRQGWPLALKNSTIFIYNGRVWVPVQVGKFKRFLQQAAQKMGMPHNDVGHFSYQEDLYKQFMSAAAIPSPDRPSGVVAINLQNGTFEFSERDHGLREFRQEDFLTHQLPFSYNDNAGCPLFMSFLDRNLPDKDSQAVIAEYIGYVFLRTLKLEKVLMLYGDGANGKSVLFNIILALIGRENVCSYSLEKLTGPDPQYRAGLENKLLNYATEISGRVDSAVFKQLISGEPIEARVLYSSAYIMDSYARLMFNCNVLPAATERTTAYFRRFLIVPFSVTIPESEQDPELADKIIRSELPGIFNWVLDGLERLLENRRFTQASNVIAAGMEYRSKASSVESFISEKNMVPGTTECELAKNMYDVYVSYCHSRNVVNVHSRMFPAEFERLGFQTEKTRNGKKIFYSTR